MPHVTTKKLDEEQVLPAPAMPEEVGKLIQKRISAGIHILQTSRLNKIRRMNEKAAAGKGLFKKIKKEKSKYIILI
jgi:hypothetical protein